MATTTNFGWTTPDDTDLVKDGAAAIRTLGSSIDTSLVDLKGGTTGQVLTKASNTDLDFSFTTPAGSPITTEGDLIIGDASGDAVRLPIGSAGTVLTSDGDTADWVAPAAGGALKFIQRSSFTDVANTSTTFDGVFTSTYKAYQVVVEKIHAASGATAGEALQLQFIYSGTTQILTYNGGFGNGGATYFGQSSSDTSELKITNQVGYDVLPNSYIMWFSYVGNASEKANVYGLGFGQNNNGGGFFAGGNATARTYTGFRFKAASGNITGTVAVYGIASS
jgi:hypothetical protein